LEFSLKTITTFGAQSGIYQALELIKLIWSLARAHSDEEIKACFLA
jgi:hypothetical protein